MKPIADYLAALHIAHHAKQGAPCTACQRLTDAFKARDADIAKSLRQTLALNRGQEATAVTSGVLMIALHLEGR